MGIVPWNDDRIKMAFAAIDNSGSEEPKPEHCQCDPEVGATPCEYCAIVYALRYARTLETKVSDLRTMCESLAYALTKIADDNGALAKEIMQAAVAGKRERDAAKRREG